MTTYFNLKNDINEIKAEQSTETRINNVRLKILENQIALLQKQIDEIKLSKPENLLTAKNIFHQ